MCEYKRTYLPEVRADELHRRIYIVPLGIPDSRSHRYQSENRVDFVKMPQKTGKSRLFIRDRNLRQPSSAVFFRHQFCRSSKCIYREWRRNDDVLRRRRPSPPLSSLLLSSLPVPNCPIDCRHCYAESRVCGIFVSVRWLLVVISGGHIRAGLFQVEIEAADFQPCTATLKSASANTREIAVKQTLRGIDSDRTCALYLPLFVENGKKNEYGKCKYMYSICRKEERIRDCKKKFENDDTVCGIKFY